MNIFKTSIGLTKTIRNVSRLREILQVLAKHGFDEVIVRSRVHLLIPNFVMPKSINREKKRNEVSDYDFWKSIGSRLRLAFEELGPSFIKVGQLLASREDLFNPTFIIEMKKLQDNVAPIDFAIAKGIIELQLGKKIETVFQSISEEPIGVASIGIVYKAKLLTGEEVVVKVQRPKIKRMILTDFEIIDFIVGNLEKMSDELKYLGIKRVIDDFFKSIKLELNYKIEANNNVKFKTNIGRIDVNNIIIVPSIYKEFSTEKILVMEYLEGKPFNKITNADDEEGLRENLEQAVKYFLHTMLTDGFFHADLHGGNFFLLPDQKIGLIDFGLVGSLSKKNRTSLVAILYALLTSNFENLVYEFLDVADYETIPNHQALMRDLKDALTPFIGMSVAEMDAATLTHSLVSTLSKHQIYLPREWFIIFRALITLDGVGKSLKIDLNIFEVIDSEIKGILGELVSKDALLEDGIWLARDIMNSVRIVPRHLSWALKEFSKKNYTIDVNPVGIKNEMNLLTRSVYFLGMMVLSSTFFISGAVIIQDFQVQSIKEIPVLTLVCWGMSLATAMRASFLYKLK
jgi:ubiquinone biosynthesis protein